MHGQHRPVQMKKAEIKRRKRVVPANFSAEEQNNYILEKADHDSEWEAVRTTQAHPAETPPASFLDTTDPRPASGPIPVDFTDAFRRRAAQSEAHDHSSIPSKRRLSTAGEYSDPYRHPQDLALPNNDSIDPSLSERGASSSSKEARRAELQREAEDMRRMLLVKERELAALGTDDA